jgi:hypothetical protein
VRFSVVAENRTIPHPAKSDPLKRQVYVLAASRNTPPQ